MPDHTRLTLETALDRLRFDHRSGRLVSLAPIADPGAELIASAPDHPVFVIQYLDEQRQFRQWDSFDAAPPRIQLTTSRATPSLTMTFTRIDGRDLDLIATVRASRRQAQSRWSVALRNGAGVEIVQVQFPFIVVPYAKDPADGEAVLTPFFTGTLLENPRPQDLGADWPQAWEIVPRNGASSHYPGMMCAQLLAHYTRRAGLYMACDDSRGHIKLFKALHHDPGIRLGMAHVGDWPRQGTRQLPYTVRLGSFRGDWYAAAEIYRQWSLKQPWATPLHRRKDVPAWLLDSPVHVTLRVQGVLDDGPVFPVKEFLPYEKSLPLLDRLAERLGGNAGANPGETPGGTPGKTPGKTPGALVAVIMSWERAGPWVYPDCFPPVGGDRSVTRFATLARQRGWQVGSFCNGSRWVMGHAWNRYDGRDYFEKHGGAAGVCRLADGQPWKETWDAAWRPSFTSCLGEKSTRRIARRFVERLLGWGLRSIQFFDQNVGASTFPCFAHDHDHPPLPGRWMTEAMASMIGEFRAAAKAKGIADAIQSVENCANETALQWFQQCDVRLTPPGTDRHVPMYHYLYHECIVMHGMMSPAPEPFHLPIANAYDGVMGEIPGGVMTGDGTLLNRDTWNWAPWEPKVGSADDGVEMIRNVTALRRGPGREFLVFGRMQAPTCVEDEGRVTWQHNGRTHTMPAVFHASWRSPARRFAIVLANWTTAPRQVTLSDRRLGRRVRLHLAARRMEASPLRPANGRVSFELPALSVALVVANET